MSPEQCRGAGTIDHRSDIYSLGCVLFHLITGRPPFDFEGMGEIISAHMREPPRAPSQLALGIPPALDALVLRCLAKSPDERFQNRATCSASASACSRRSPRTARARRRRCSRRRSRPASDR
jgi:serine/threonine-protein kinase